MNVKPSLGFVGVGNVALTLARLCSAAGYRVVAVYSRTVEKRTALAADMGALAAESADAVIESADLTLLTVPDDAIETVARSIRVSNGAGKAVVHTSGAHDAALLSSLASQGVMTGSLHPAFPFAKTGSEAEALRGVVFAVEAEDSSLRDWLAELVTALDGVVLELAAANKAVYHSALVFASNYTVTLFAIAERLLMQTGADRELVAQVLLPLLSGTIENLRRQGIPMALTGPLVRGDHRTVSAHLTALEGLDEQIAHLYRELAQASLPLLAARQINTNAWQEFLQEHGA
ncbi:MAG: DUF2520 domain-containing protein [Anaerolineae bacterium]|nr:DUF2520 domain-containing protein [Anaerolineae bacterium]